MLFSHQLCPQHIRLKNSYLSVRVYSPLTLLEASRTRNVPSGVFLIISFTCSLDKHIGVSISLCRNQWKTIQKREEKVSYKTLKNVLMIETRSL